MSTPWTCGLTARYTPMTHPHGNNNVMGVYLAVKPQGASAHHYLRCTQGGQFPFHLFQICFYLTDSCYCCYYSFGSMCSVYLPTKSKSKGPPRPQNFETTVSEGFLPHKHPKVLWECIQSSFVEPPGGTTQTVGDEMCIQVLECFSYQEGEDGHVR